MGRLMGVLLVALSALATVATSEGNGGKSDSEGVMSLKAVGLRDQGLSSEGTVHSSLGRRGLLVQHVNTKPTTVTQKNGDLIQVIKSNQHSALASLLRHDGEKAKMTIDKNPKPSQVNTQKNTQKKEDLMRYMKSNKNSALASLLKHHGEKAKMMIDKPKPSLSEAKKEEKPKPSHSEAKKEEKPKPSHSQAKKEEKPKPSHSQAKKEDKKPATKETSTHHSQAKNKPYDSQGAASMENVYDRGVAPSMKAAAAAAATMDKNHDTTVYKDDTGDTVTEAKEEEAEEASEEAKGKAQEFLQRMRDSGLMYGRS